MNTEMKMMVANAVVKPKEDRLEHHGILGMKWGIRRFQPYGKGGYDPEHKGRFVGIVERAKIRKMSLYNKASASVDAETKGDDSMQRYINKTIKPKDAEEYEKLKDVAKTVKRRNQKVEEFKKTVDSGKVSDVVDELDRMDKKDREAIEHILRNETDNKRTIESIDKEREWRKELLSTSDEELYKKYGADDPEVGELVVMEKHDLIDKNRHKK